MIKHIRNTSLLILTVGLTACVSPPRNVDAEIPLVTPSSFVSSELVPSQYWSILDNPLETQFTYQDYLVQMSAPYESALGAHCRLLTFSQDNSIAGTRVTCGKHSNQGNKSLWFLTKDLSNTQSKVTLK